MAAEVTHRCAVLGKPIAHSLSPVIHNTAYDVLGLTGWHYGAHEVDEAELGAFIRSCGPEWVGLSCTMPLKRKLLEFGEASFRARTLRAGNTYVFPREGRPAFVDNTDVAGILDPIRRAGFEQAASAIIVGAGATARSALLALSELGVRDVLVVARSVERAHASLDPVASLLGLLLDIRPWGVPVTARRDVLLSVVPVPLGPELVRGLLPLTRLVFDVQYGHGPSQFADGAAAAGTPLLDGLDLLVTQAIGQIELFTGETCPVEPLAAAVRAEMARRTGER
nr:shikimate dehydrogenase [Propionibacterium sp.]